jgi:ribose-phosphate pyrophosphokinase
MLSERVFEPLDLSDRFRLFCGRASPALALEVADLLGRELCEVRFQTFHEGEVHVQIEQSVRGVDAYVIQPTCLPVNDNLVELLVLIDALRRASVATITAVIPYFGYARQDHKSTGREPITAKLVANLLTTAGADRVLSIDLHSTQIQGFFDIPVDHLTAVTTLSRHLRDHFDLSNGVVVASDVGRAKMADKYAMILELPMVVVHKRRSGVAGLRVEVVDIVGDVAGKTPVLIDDVIASGSIYQQADALVEAGSEPVIISVSHGVLVGEAVQRLHRPSVQALVTTNTVPVPDCKRMNGAVKVLTIAPLLADAIARIHNRQSVSEVFRAEQLEFPV